MVFLSLIDCIMLNVLEYCASATTEPNVGLCVTVTGHGSPVTSSASPHKDIEHNGQGKVQRK